MKRLRFETIATFLPALLLCSSVWGSVPPQPGTINYVEGRASIGGKLLSENSLGSARLASGQVISTENGKVEMLLTPGIFFRLGDNSSAEMVSPGLANTVLRLERGRAMVEVAEIRPENNVRVTVNGVSVQLVKAGLYDFDVDHNQIRVFDGRAIVQTSTKQIEVKGGHGLILNAPGKLKPRRFDKKAYEDDFYRWASLRSSYVSEANIDASRTYGGGGGWSAEPWYGSGWYWDSWFDAYTFIPADGFLFSPFGCGFYSPWYAFRAPYFGYGYGYGSGGYHHFGPNYRPHYGGASGFAGHAYTFRGGNFGRGGSFHSSSGGVRGGSGGVRGGGGGFHGGGGGFHGGGGGHR